MIAAIHFENLVFILFVLVAFFFQALAKVSTKANKGSSPQNPRPPSPPPTPPRTPAGSDEERIRKFLEALGQPASSQPPAPVAPRPTYQKPIVVSHLPPLKSPLPPLTTRPPDLPAEMELPEKIPLPRTARVFTPKTSERPFAAEPPPIIQTSEERFAATTIVPEQSRKDFIALLRSPSGLREAIILREIFGPPRSFQPFDLVGTV